MPSQSPQQFRLPFFLFLLLWGMLPLTAQTRFSGVVLDSVTLEPIPYASVYFADNRGTGTVTSAAGSFDLSSPQNDRTIIISSTGYRQQQFTLRQGEKRNMRCRILLAQEDMQLHSVVVHAKRRRYSKKNNPAVDLIRRAIAAKDSNRIESAPAYSYRTYERMLLSDDDFRSGEGFLYLKHDKCLQWADSSRFTDRRILPLSMREKLIQTERLPHKSERSVVLARRLDGVEESFDEGPMTTNLEEIFRPINIYDNDIPIMLSRFPSPMSSNFATGFYKYFITDTVMIGGESCIEMAFSPFNPQSAGFTGRLWIARDDYALRRIVLNLPISSNVNWVTHLRIAQDFEREPCVDVSGAITRYYRVLRRQDFQALLSAASFIPQGVEVDQTRIFTDYRIGEGSVDKNPASVTYLATDSAGWSSSPRETEGYWNVMRPEPLPPTGQKLLAFMQYLRRDRTYKAATTVAKTLLTGYLSLPLSSRDSVRRVFDLGPIHNTLSGNKIEGLRLRLGGMTLASLSPHFFAQGYVAYGFRDERWKWRGKFTYSSMAKQLYADEFPHRNLSFIASYDLYTPGQAISPMYKDNVLTMLGTMSNMRRVYVEEYRLEYDRDWGRDFGTVVWASRQRNEPAGTLRYEQIMADGTVQPIHSYRTTELGVSLRYEPGRIPYNGRKGPNTAFNLVRRSPVFELEHRMAFKGLLGGDFGYQRTEFRYKHQFWLSLFGMMDATLRAGKVWTQAPYPLLELPPVNESYILQKGTFQLMKPMEFISDRYAQFHLTYHAEGLLLNRLPLIKRLAWREIFSIHGMWGDLSKCNASGTVGSFLFPEETIPMDNTWYLEGSVGLENIFRILRVEYFRRFTQLSTAPDKWGIRARLQLSF
ncbi:DUF5686 and carboxypeptidase-like regulatory domain-containing protein [Porphyromonas loveana]|uniref:DUF5686 and carboxypeptidase-like regulatory domain-containing protein n=1 Tax=Porphyromonas loveana TaxID=1884669 RepID=UPI0035A19E2E